MDDEIEEKGRRTLETKVGIAFPALQSFALTLMRLGNKVVCHMTLSASYQNQSYTSLSSKFNIPPLSIKSAKTSVRS